MDHRITLPLLLCSLACAPAAERPLQAAQLGDLAPRRLIVPVEDETPRATLVPLTHAQAVPDDVVLAERPRPHRTRSREYWFAAAREELDAGIELPTSAPGAVVRLQPLDTEARAPAGIDPTALVLVDAAGVEHVDGAAMATFAGWEQLRDADVGLAPGTTAFAIDSALGHGAFVLRTAAMPAAPQYLVHVAERDSAIELVVHGDSDTISWGDTITIEAALANGELVSAVGRVRDPWGKNHEHELVEHGDALRGSFVVDDERPSHGALWTAEIDARVRTEDGDEARRCGRGAFGYGVPSAGFVGELRVDEEPRGGFAIALPLEIAARGRYGVSATLYGRDALGRARPVAVAQAAAWLEPGTDELALLFDDTVLAHPTAFGPYQLRDLRLVDQGRVAVLHRQAFAATID